MGSPELRQKASQLGFTEPSQVSIGFQPEAEVIELSEGRRIIEELSAGQLRLARGYLDLEGKTDEELKVVLVQMLNYLGGWTESPGLDVVGDTETVSWELDGAMPVAQPDMVSDIILLHRLGVLEPSGFQVDGLVAAA